MNGICMLCFGPWLKRCIIFWHARCPCSRGKRPVTYLDMDTVGANANDTDRDISLFWIKHIPYFWYWLQAVYFCCTIWSTVGIHWQFNLFFFLWLFLFPSVNAVLFNDFCGLCLMCTLGVFAILNDLTQLLFNKTRSHGHTGEVSCCSLK